MRESSNINTWSSEEFLRNDLEELKSRLRSECINVLRQKDSYHSVLLKVSPNPEESQPC